MGVVQEYSIPFHFPQNKNSMLFMTTLSKLQGHGLKKRTCSRKHDEKKELDTWRFKILKRELDT